MKKEFFLIYALTVTLISGCASSRVTFRKEPVQTKTVSQRVHFPFGKETISSKDQSILDDVSQIMSSDKNAVAILEGHADPIGAPTANEILSEERARDIRVRLRDLGIDASRLTIISKGEREPLVSSKSREGNAPNRRVEIQVTLTDSKKERK